MTLLRLALCLCVWPVSASAQTALTNTEAMEAQIASLFAESASQKPLLYFCQTGIFDDLGDLDTDWGPPLPGPSPGRITSAAWDLGDNRYLYAYQLTNPNFLDEGSPLGGWDVAVFEQMSGFRIPLRYKQIIPVDYDGDQVLDTSFRTTDHACNAVFMPDEDCSPFTGPFAVFTGSAGLPTDACSRSWSDFYDQTANDEIVDARVNYDPAGLSAEFAVEYDPFCCNHGIGRSTQVFGFVTDAPPDTVEGVFLGGASASIRIIAPVPKVLLVEGICGNVSDWNTFDEVLSDSGFVVRRLQYASPFFSLRPKDYVNILSAALEGMGPGKVAVVAHSMGGLIAREYMRKQAATPGKKGKIAQLVTLGTPHHGSDFLAQVLSWWAPARWVVGKVIRDPCLSSPLSRDALRDMTPGSWFLNRLNYGGQPVDTAGSHGWDTHQPETSLPAGVYLASIAGTGTFCKPLVRDMFWKPKGVYRPNDCTVATGGSLLANTNTFRAPDPTLSLEKPAAHTNRETTPCGEAYYQFNTLAQRVARILLVSPTAPPISVAGDERPQLARLASEEDEDFQAAPAIEDSVPAGQVVSETFSIPTTSRVRFALASTDARLSLLDPNGAAITVNDTSAASGIGFFETDDGALRCFEIANPLSGTWTMRIDAAASTLGQRVGGLVQYASGSFATLSVASDLLYAGDVMRVRGQLITGPTRETDVTWSCYVVRPDDAPTPVTLYDDGAHGDSLAGDGIYGNTVTPTGGVGLYSLIASASVPGVGPLAAVAYCEVADTQNLRVTSSDIALSEDPPSAGETLTVYATVHNNSSKAAMGVDVEIRDLRADTVLGTSTVDLGAGGEATVQAQWTPAAPDTHEISVQVSPYVLDESDYSDNTASRVVVVGSPVAVDPEHTSSTLRFDPPRPNPTSFGVMFSFSLPQRHAALLEVYDILGRRVRSWSWTSLSAGTHSIEWDGRGPDGGTLATGVYVCRLKVGTERLQRRIVLRR